VKFFFDNSLPPRFCTVIRVLAEGDDHVLTYLRERFAEDTPDTVWIPELAAERDWIVISADARITKARHEREAWQQAGLIGFFLAKGWASLNLWDQAWRLVLWWPRIVDQAGRVRAPATFLVPVKGTKFEQLR
jgi:type IV secretory pathway TrbF-like protein